jgi:hypothetical protein
MKKTLIILLVMVAFSFAIQSIAGDLAFERARNKALTEGVRDADSYFIVNTIGTKGIVYTPKENILLLLIFDKREVVYCVEITESDSFYAKTVGKGKPQTITREESIDFAYQFMENFSR